MHQSLCNLYNSSLNDIVKEKGILFADNLKIRKIIS